MAESILRIIALAIGGPTPLDGKYVVAYDPSGQLVSGLVVTDDPALAFRAPAATLLELWRSVDPLHPTRPDGQPNRPLTAFSVQTMPAPGVIGPDDDELDVG
jgi:hypothetical protein